MSENEKQTESLAVATPNWSKRVILKLVRGVWETHVTVQEGELPLLTSDVRTLCRVLLLEQRRLARAARLSQTQQKEVSRV